MIPAFRCPTCARPLVESASEFACPNGHRFDRAKEGYVNLLPSGRLKGRPAGDDDAMVRARRAVFDAGLYQPLIDAVADAVAVAAPTFVLDAGCGEGSYLAHACELAGAQGWGIDISKPAVKLAARRSPHLRYAVASSYKLPFDDDGFDVVLNVFSPRDFSEMMRVARPGGIAIVATPGPHHLSQLKHLVYATPREHGETSIDAQPPDEISEVSFSLDLAEPSSRSNLLQMTPYWWSATPAARDKIMHTLRTVDIDIHIATYRFSDPVSG